MRSLYWCAIHFLLKRALTTIYRLHNEYFPHVRDLPSEASLELIDILIHAIGGSQNLTV